MDKYIIASSSSGPILQILESPRVFTPLHILSPKREIPFQSYEGFEFRDEPQPPHRFDTRLGVTIQDPPKERALDAFKLGGDLNEDVRINAYENFMSDN